MRHLARKHAATGSHTAADVAKQYAIQKGRCYWCHVNLNGAYHVDHIIPLARGGSNGPENICCSCQHCNQSKSAKPPHEWNGRLI